MAHYGPAAGRLLCVAQAIAHAIRTGDAVEYTGLRPLLLKADAAFQAEVERGGEDIEFWAPKAQPWGECMRIPDDGTRIVIEKDPHGRGHGPRP